MSQKPRPHISCPGIPDLLGVGSSLSPEGVTTWFFELHKVKVMLEFQRLFSSSLELLVAWALARGWFGRYFIYFLLIGARKKDENPFGW